MQRKQCKNFIKKIPIVGNVMRWFFGGSPGDWLYRHPSIISWMFEPELKKQLPLLYRIFASYCFLQNRMMDCKCIRGGRHVFRIVSRLTQIFSLTDSIALDLPSYTIHLDLLDPRFLYILEELNSVENLLTSLLVEGDTFIDVGANHGSYSIIASKLLGKNGLVVSVEPQPRLAGLIEKSLAANSHCCYRVLQVALGDCYDEIEFFVPLDSSGTAGMFAEYSATHAHRCLKVHLRRFDDIMDWQEFPGRVFVKLDVEGNELFFLNGAKKMFNARKPCLMMEINPKSLNASCVSVENLKKTLDELGYKYFSEFKKPAEILPLAKLDTSRQQNVIMLPQKE